MQTQEIAIGQSIYFDELGYTYTVNNWKTYLLPALKEIISLYEALEMGQFNLKVYDDITTNKHADIRARYQHKMLKSVPKSLESKCLATIDAMLLPLESKIDYLLNNLYYKANGIYGRAVVIAWDQCSIVDGKPVLNEAQIKSDYEQTIQTESEMDFYKRFLSFKQAYDGFRDYFNANGFNADNVLFGDEGIISEDKDGYLQLNNGSIYLFR